MRPLAFLVLVAFMTPGVVADDDLDDGCASRLVVYSGPLGVNPGAVCDMPDRLVGHDGENFCQTTLERTVGGVDCPIASPGLGADTRFILPSEHVTVGHVGDFEHAPDGVVVTLHGLGHDGTEVTLQARHSRWFVSDAVPIEGSGELLVLLTLPDERVLATVYRTLDLP